MGINYWAILVCAVLSLVIGSIWYGPLFGKMWMRLCGVTEHATAAEKKRMQKNAMPLYLVQFILTLFALFVLVHLTGFTARGGALSALWVWGGFIMPTVAGSCMWTNESSRVKWQRFIIQAGFQLVCFLVFGAILGAWH